MGPFYYIFKIDVAFLSRIFDLWRIKKHADIETNKIKKQQHRDRGRERDKEK